MVIDDIVCRNTEAANLLLNLSIYLEAKIEQSEALRAAGPSRSSIEGGRLPSNTRPTLRRSELGLVARTYRERSAAGATHAWTALSPQRSR